MAEWLRRVTHNTSYFLAVGGNKAEVLFVFIFAFGEKIFSPHYMFRGLGEKISSDCIT